jgi:hypothetical protein
MLTAPGAIGIVPAVALSLALSLAPASTSLLDDEV